MDRVGEGQETEGGGTRKGRRGSEERRNGIKGIKIKG